MNQRKILREIQRHKKFLISTHVNPDPDAIASELALALYLKSLGKQVRVINDDGLPLRYAFLPGVAMVQEFRAGQKVDFDAALVLDCGDLDRIGEVKRLIPKEKTVINIDHHLTNDRFGDLNLVVPSASSTTEVLYDLLKAAGARITAPMAELLYVGIMTDTGCFRYDSTTARAHVAAAELMRHGFSVSELYRKVYEGVALQDFRQFAKMIDDFETRFDGKAVMVMLPKNKLKKFSEGFDVKDKIFTGLRSIRGVEVIVIFSEFRPGETRVNFRSQGPRVNVAALAAAFGGGGHRKASGCVVPGNFSEAKRKIIRKLREIL